jgi:hypothetical protein
LGSIPPILRVNRLKTIWPTTNTTNREKSKSCSDTEIPARAKTTEANVISGTLR